MICDCSNTMLYTSDNSTSIVQGRLESKALDSIYPIHRLLQPAPSVSYGLPRRDLYGVHCTRLTVVVLPHQIRPFMIQTRELIDILWTRRRSGSDRTCCCEQHCQIRPPHPTRHASSKFCRDDTIPNNAATATSNNSSRHSWWSPLRTASKNSSTSS